MGLTYRLIQVNGELGAAVMIDGQLFSILSFVTDGQRICGIYNVRNPDKLAGIALRDLGPRPCLRAAASGAEPVACHKHQPHFVL